MLIPKKRFGQNFLTDPHKAENLVNALEIRPGDTILEIGPGTGVLTELILGYDVNLTAVELDRDLLDALRQRFNHNDKFKLIESDIIDINPTEFASSNGLKVIGNLPYNISGAIVQWLIDYFAVIRLAVITVQKEVGARLKAEPGNRDYGSLSVLVQSHYDIRKLFDIPPGCFSPMPKVDSSALSLLPNKKISNDIEFASFSEFLRGCFAHKRKKLANSLQSRGFKGGRMFTRDEVEEYLARLGKRPDIRAEHLSLSDFEELFRLSRL